MMAVKACFSAGWPVWPSSAAFVMLAQVYPNHEPLLMFLFSSNFHLVLFSCPQMERITLKSSWSWGRDSREILRHVGFTTWYLV